MLDLSKATCPINFYLLVSQAGTALTFSTHLSKFPEGQTFLAVCSDAGCHAQHDSINYE